ncbi:polysaccharide deacetylase family protein [Chitinophaga sedimenti]|uniref:polysaccharide deacetylase family protein n=1 Tax=Chitinophaga sedimenti TaxID=2033606 RepID=UPI0020044C97|nr:polysaccharide deacetylase family protein [Chitinophaga sedimenti]MCK7555102.1 polysaccharide deacetylase family protein [Chitinophaga sedimenti]
MNPLKKVYYQGVKMMNLAVLKKLYRGHIILPYHHLVSDGEVPHIKHLYPWKGTKAFEADLDFLASNFKPISLPDILSCVRNGQPIPDNSFLLTFDDGLREVKEVIAPMLLKKGLPAVFFLNSAFVDNKEMYYHFKTSLLIDALEKNAYSDAALAEFRRILQEPAGSPVEALIRHLHRIKYGDRAICDKLGETLGISFTDYLKNVRPFINSDEIQSLVNQGFHLGGHSIDHPYYPPLSLEEQLRQTTGSVDYVTNRFNLDYKVFAFPHYDTGVSKAFFDTLLNGPKPKLDLIFGTSNHKQDISPRILHRFNCERPSVGIEEQVKGILMYGILHAWAGKNKVVRI